jgi:ABC-type nitrate/sulfonate/bicarbonate transport system substrate-binding protein
MQRHGSDDFVTMVRGIAACALGSFFLTLPLADSGAATAAEVAFGITSATAFSLPHYIATEKKYYESEGIVVDAIVAGAAVGLLKQLAGGSLHLAQAATDQSLRAMLHGAPIKIIAGAASNAPFRLVAAKSIKSWSDLKGKTVSVGGLTDVTLYFMRVMARKNGLADTDYDLIYGGGTPSRFAQLASGAAAAALLTNPVDFAALEQGFVDLGSVPQYLPNWAQNNIVVDTRWAQSNRAAITGFLRAQIRGSRYFYNAANRDDVIGILAKYTRTGPQVAAATYDLYMREEVIARDAALFPEGINANLHALKEMGELTELPPLTRFIDESFLAQASRQ